VLVNARDEFCVHSEQLIGAMETTGNLLILQCLVMTILYQLLRLIFIPVQRIYWQLNGTARKLREARLPENYERSAQVLDVVLCHKFCDVLVTRVEHFLCTHNRFENPQYIIDNDNITLMTINEHDAVFCETEEKGSPHASVCNVKTSSSAIAERPRDARVTSTRKIARRYRRKSVDVSDF